MAAETVDVYSSRLSPTRLTPSPGLLGLVLNQLQESKSITYVHVLCNSIYYEVPDRGDAQGTHRGGKPRESPHWPSSKYYFTLDRDVCVDSFKSLNSFVLHKHDLHDVIPWYISLHYM